MIDYIKGAISDKEPGWITVGVGGIGVRVDVPLSYYEKQDWQAGAELNLFTRLIIKEDGINLYGFCTIEERNLFDLIIGVPGFGPRMGLSVLGAVSVAEFYRAILEGDIEALCIIPGIGKKLAQRLVLELKEKLQQVIPVPEDLRVKTTGVPQISPKEEALRALGSLGYTRAESLPILNRICAEEEASTTEELVKFALKKLASR
ncbi:MAG: Holliday junction branch migration protein RuvA [Dethiobacteria bacterium]